MKLPVHRWYRYSAGYSSEWAVKLIRHWGVTRVLDPFGGSGTTCLAAQESGASSYAVEVHPTVARIARAKLLWETDPDNLRDVVSRVLRIVDKKHAVDVPSSPLVAKCFPDSESLADLLRIRDAVNALPDGESTTELAWLAFVSIIRACSPVGTAQWQYVLPNKSKRRVAEPIAAFQAAGELFADDMETHQFLLGASPADAHLLSGDARTLDGVPEAWADAVITSPPYANNYDYADALRLEQIVLGDIEGWSDLRPLRDVLLRSATQNIGTWKAEEALKSTLMAPILDEFIPVYEELSEVRKTRGGHKAYHAMLAGYFFDNSKVFQALRQKTSPGVKVCYVVGDSAPYGVHAPVERWLGELAIAAGFSSWEFTKVRDRNTKWKNRKHTHPLHEGYLWIEG
ncbi:site-specific DNA-methyltransferase [Schaalia sp. lx-260]|uniref:site-specific DNA-methyltransferase n=1 Tax=Schaalia sp. lx-260 TaxID=2899082 RepID=UPI001E413180|nr:site-specific DNA-methyltransferase [Schaalia sp. lx-260]MCD4550253.1 site-specific DNA-methyltransferase [Schaalia sp. lx-260]